MQKNSEEVVGMVSSRLREWIHEVNNALFITKGFLEEVQTEIQDKNYTKPDFDHENLTDMMETIGRSVERVDTNLQKLRKFAKEEIFELSGVKKDSNVTKELTV